MDIVTGVGVVDNDLDGVPLATGRSAPQAIAAAPRHRAVAPDPSIRTEGLYYNILYDTVKQMRKKQNFSAIDVENELLGWARIYLTYQIVVNMIFSLYGQDQQCTYRHRKEVDVETDRRTPMSRKKI